MGIKRSISERIFEIFNICLMMALIVVTFYPLLYVAFASLSDSSLLRAHSGVLFAPLGTNVDAYKRAFQNPAILSGYGNSIWILVVGTLLSMLITVLTAYVLSRKNFKPAGVVSFFIVFTMYFSGGMIPFYLTVKKLGFENSLWSQVIPALLSTYNLIIMRTAFVSVPVSLEESAKLDGAGHLTVLFRIMIPLSRATLAVVALYYAVGYWNSWFNAMLFLRDRVKYPLQLVMQEILIQNDTANMTTALSDSSRTSVAESIKYAIIVIATIPILVVYPFVQRYFVKGTMLGAVKE